MEVDRISRIGPLTSQASPAWQKAAVRRRRFVEELEPLLEDDSEPADRQAAAQESAARDDSSFSASDDAAPDPPDPATPGFRAIA